MEGERGWEKRKENETREDKRVKKEKELHSLLPDYKHHTYHLARFESE